MKTNTRYGCSACAKHMNMFFNLLRCVLSRTLFDFTSTEVLFEKKLQYHSKSLTESFPNCLGPGMCMIFGKVLIPNTDHSFI